MTAYTIARHYQSWGRAQRALHKVARPQFVDELPALLAEDGGRDGATMPVLAVGLQRSYGDSCLNSGGRLLDMTRLDRVIAFDRTKGILRAEAGISLGQLLQIIVPAGYFLPTTPGTRFVTLGGAVANDVHGKNHHKAGSFGNSVLRIGLLRSDLGAIEVSRDTKPELFAATIGGLGLTGVIAWIELRLAQIPSTNLDVERLAFHNLEEFFELARSSAERFDHTVAWVDCSTRGADRGRGIFQRARWSTDRSLTPHRDTMHFTLQVDVPEILLNRISLRLFNATYWRLQKHAHGRRKLHYRAFFYPLDAIGGWNRLYGRRGFYQYQCVIPPVDAVDATGAMLDAIAKAGTGSFLAVLKTFGPTPSIGLLSFPREGATLTLDFANKGDATLRLLAALDSIVKDAHGRLYPAKDGRMPAHMFRAGYPTWSEFARHLDPSFSSDFWRRVSSEALPQ